MTVQGIFMSWVVVSDLEKAVNYYRDVMGLTLHEKQDEFGWAELSGPDGMRLGLAQANDQMDMKAGANAVVCINVEDLQKSRQELDGKVNFLGEVIEVPGHALIQLAQDLDGNRLNLVQMIDQ